MKSREHLEFSDGAELSIVIPGTRDWWNLYGQYPELFKVDANDPRKAEMLIVIVINGIRGIARFQVICVVDGGVSVVDTALFPAKPDRSYLVHTEGGMSIKDDSRCAVSLKDRICFFGDDYDGEIAESDIVVKSVYVKRIPHDSDKYWILRDRYNEIIENHRLEDNFKDIINVEAIVGDVKATMLFAVFGMGDDCYEFVFLSGDFDLWNKGLDADSILVKAVADSDALNYRYVRSLNKQ